MHFQLTHPLPRTCYVAVSGGADSMVALHWLAQVEGRVQGVVHFHHNTGDFADACWDLVRARAHEIGCDFLFRRLYRNPDEGASLENFWREQRYRFFHEISAVNGNAPIVLAHNMDDCLENYVKATMVDGHLGTIPYRHGPCIRPFRLWKRADIEDYAKRHGIRYLQDPSNLDHSKFKRAELRRLVVPRLKRYNPGIYRVVQKAIVRQDKYDER
ncbi:MAG: tRNA lysidine(34) synthetase TilS [Candidatus Altiarchaeales archaeon]|nr:tRNA lysidine(34) synthetase TilS [Candidatus Altiarchaeales archaeon]